MWFSIPVDEHVSLRLITPMDAAEMFSIIDRERERLGQWMPWIANTQNLQDEELAIQRHVVETARLDAISTAITVDNAIVGATGIPCRDREAKWAEIGYWIDAAHEGQGIVTRCVRKLEQLCFQELDCQRVQITNDVSNARSRAIPEHLGYTLEGILKQHHIKDAYGTIGDQCVYALLREAWNQRTSEKDS